MTDLTKLSAAGLAKFYNAVTDGKPVKKFESQPRALSRTLAELDRMGLTVEQAVAKFHNRGLGDLSLIAAAVEAPAVVTPAADAPAAPTGGLMTVTFPELPPRVVVDVVTGETRPRPASVHGPVRRVEGNPVTAAKKAAEAAAAPLRALRLVTGAPAVTAAPMAVKTRAVKAPAEGGPARSNATVPLMVEALRRPGGATLAELTKVSGWRAPVEMANLRIMARKVGFTLAHDGAAGDARRFRAEFTGGAAKAG